MPETKKSCSHQRKRLHAVAERYQMVASIEYQTLLRTIEAAVEKNSNSSGFYSLATAPLFLVSARVPA